MKKDEVFLAILPVVLDRRWDTKVTTPEIARIAQDMTNEVWSVVNKTSKSTPDQESP